VTDVTPSGDTLSQKMAPALPDFLRKRIGLVRDYATAISGSAGRLVFSLLYFVALANTLSIADFGLFATASATGVMLSRIFAFGFITALYRVATVRPALIGVYTAGSIAMALLSIPVVGLAGLGAFELFFSGQMALAVFVTVIAAECLLWRPVEAVVIVNNGMGKFGSAAILVIFGTLIRAVAAGALMFWPERDLATWSLVYLAANGISLLVAVAFFYPRHRLRLKPRIYLRRLPDSLYVAGAEMLFYLQMEMDKLLVLAVGGPHLAGIYAIIMRLVDLTAIPIRTFTMMLVQRLMRTPDMLARTLRRIGIESGVFLVSTLALGALALTLMLFPNMLGANVSEAAPLVGLALFVPGLRNLVEYQAELLFARGQTLIRALNLALIAGLKAVLLSLILVRSLEVEQLIMALNGVFALLYLASMLLTYSAMRMPSKRI
jgi:O-antigen/teichoic acid export membrane protein